MQKEIKEHFAKYRNIYITAGIVVLTSVVTGLTVYSVTKTDIKPVSIGDNNNNNAINFGGTLNYTVKSLRKGPPSWVIRCIETGQLYSSQEKASKELGINKASLSRHLNGLLDEVNNLHFERVCMSA
jgi:hypothetical protein